MRRQLPKPLRDEFGGKQLWKRSLNIKDPAEARTAFTVLNADLERLFATARQAIAERAARTVLTPMLAADAVARMAAVRTGGRFDAFPVLGNIYISEEAASMLLGGAPLALLQQLVSPERGAEAPVTLLPVASRNLSGMQRHMPLTHRIRTLST